MGPMGELGALFNPGMRHELEERQAKAARREEEGNARDGDLRIDLESGVAVIGIRGADDQVTADPDGNGSQARTEAAASDDSETAAEGAEEAVDAQDEPAQAPALRPRGKRGLSASRR